MGYFYLKWRDFVRTLLVVSASQNSRTDSNGSDHSYFVMNLRNSSPGKFWHFFVFLNIFIHHEW